MVGPSLSEYWESVEYFCALCREALPDVLVSFIVVGSLGAGDAVPGWSDVDAHLVVREATREVRETAARLQRRVTERFPAFQTDRGSRFCVFVHSRREVLEGSEDVSFLAQWDLKRIGVVACGEDLPALLGDPPLDKGWLDRHTEWMIGFLARERDAPSHWKGVNAIGFILSGARVAILKRGEYAKRKDEIAGIFTRLYPERAATLGRAMEDRLRWPEVEGDEAEIDGVYEEATDFLWWVRSLP
ncbi:MAG: hypothetical protein A3K65_02320 [Euryarchaeota archaeon RBG_16_68_12]|nr:MAG: hypothetical protein A3K65_02320 [Euryarchaeota archaeon RBG_16_68_12]